MNRDLALILLVLAIVTIFILFILQRGMEIENKHTEIRNITETSSGYQAWNDGRGYRL